MSLEGIDHIYSIIETEPFLCLDYTAVVLATFVSLSILRRYDTVFGNCGHGYRYLLSAYL